MSRILFDRADDDKSHAFAFADLRHGGCECRETPVRIDEPRPLS